MSHLFRGVLAALPLAAVLLAALLLAALLLPSACSRPKPPEGNVPAEPLTAEPAVADGGVSATPPEPTSPLGEAAEGAAAPVVQTLFVRERRSDCEGEGTRKCLQVRENESGEWRNLYASIEGFAYEEAHAYELRVEVTAVPHPQADGTSLRYRLLEVVSKRKVAMP